MTLFIPYICYNVFRHCYTILTFKLLSILWVVLWDFPINSALIVCVIMVFVSFCPVKYRIAIHWFFYEGFMSYIDCLFVIINQSSCHVVTGDIIIIE